MCPKCRRTTARKYGKRNGIQKYQCRICKYVFENQAVKKKQCTVMWQEYVDNKQTQKQLAKKYSLSLKTVRKRLNEAGVKHLVIKPQSVVVLMDTTYFGRNSAVMVFRDSKQKKNLYWKFMKYETIEEYKLGIMHLTSLGIEMKGIVCDGRRGIFQAFKDIPIQMCNFHQVAIIRRYLTRNPKLQASIELLEITKKLTKTDEPSFKGMLKNWYDKWKDFLKERTINEETGKWHYTHKRLRSAYLSLIHNLEYLFTYQKYPQLGIPNTTNSLEGIFTDVKTNIRVHKGLQEKRKKLLIEEILKN